MNPRASACLLLRRLLCAAVLAFGVPVQSAETAAATGNPPAATSAAGLTPEQKAAVDSLDVMLAGYDALVAKITDPRHLAVTKLFLDSLKARRDVLRKSFDQGFYNDLKLDIYHEYQRTALWLAPLKTPPRAAKPDESFGTDQALALAQANRTALVTLEWQIKDLEGRANRRSAGPAREAEQLAVKAIREHHRALGENFSKAGYDALLGEISALGQKRRSDTGKAAGP